MSEPPLPEQSWRTMGDAPRDVEKLIVTDGEATSAVSFYEAGFWRLGRRTDRARAILEFEPLFWMPFASPNNPFRAAFPDGRPSLRARHALALSKGSDV